MARRREGWDEAETRVMRGEERVARRPPPPGPPPWWRENWWIWLALLGVLVIGGLLLAYVAGQDEDGQGETTAALVEVPRVVGLSEDRAVGRLERAGFEVEVDRAAGPAPDGRVFAQDPEPGSRVQPGTTVTISVAEARPAETVTVTETTPTEPPPAEPQPETVQVPDLVGQDHVVAGAAGEELGLVADTYPVESTELQGIVVAQSPAPGSELRKGETVRLNVSLGSEERGEATLPDLTGPKAADARAACREAGFACRTVYRAAPSEEEVGEVLDQRPAAGTAAPILTQITLFVGR